MYRIATAQVWVHDQDEALDFYTKKLGMEVHSDVTVPEMGNFRWLTVGPPGQEDVSIVLMAIPGPPVMDAETAEQLKTLMAKGPTVSGDLCDGASRARTGALRDAIATLSQLSYGPFLVH